MVTYPNNPSNGKRDQAAFLRAMYAAHLRAREMAWRGFLAGLLAGLCLGLLVGCSGVDFVGHVDLPDRQIRYYRPYTGIPGVRLHERLDAVVVDKDTGRAAYVPGGAVSFKGSGLPMVGGTVVGPPPFYGEGR